MAALEGGSFPNPFEGDSGLSQAKDVKINLKKIHRDVGLIDFDHPPEGIVFIGEPLPQVATDQVMKTLSTPSMRLTKK